MLLTLFPPFPCPAASLPSPAVCPVPYALPLMPCSSPSRLSASLDSLACFAARSVPVTHSSVRVFDLVAFAAWSKRLSLWGSHETQRVCPRLSLQGRGQELAYPFYTVKLNS